jgi:3-dehydroquinate synthase
MSQTLWLKLPHGEYPVVVGQDLLTTLPHWPDGGEAPKALILVDQAVSALADPLEAELQHRGWATARLSVPVSEDFKQLDALMEVYGALLDLKATRESILVAIGGGVIGDAAGFVAATYQRGIRWVGVPTTLLAQVDSALGGKTAVNHPRGKNLIGAFHQPSLVLSDPACLNTLPERDRISGLGEIVKYALTYSPEFLTELEQHWRRLLALDPAVLVPAVARCCELKLQAVAADEHDVLGIREVLNFGHTFGHALEAATAYGAFRHGEAVLWGMRFAVKLSQVCGHLPEAQALRLLTLLWQIPVPPLPALAWPVLRNHIKHDKKARGNRVRWVLLQDVGQVYLDLDVPEAALEQVWVSINHPGS